MNDLRPALKRLGAGSLLAVVILGAPAALANVYWTSVLVMTGVYVLMASSMRTLLLIGHISLGHIGFMLLGAYTSALLMLKLGLPFIAAMLGGGALSGAVALVLGYPFLRVRGIYFAILTLLTSESFRLLAFNWPSLTGGAIGLFDIPSPGRLAIPGLGVLDFEQPRVYYYLTVAVVALCLAVLHRLERSRLGFKWRAIREAEKLSEAVGVNVLWFKIVCFVVACFFAGVAGALFAHFQRGLSADASSIFSVLTSIYLLVYIIVGGESRFAGPLVGTVVLLIVAEFARPLEEYQPMMIGGLAIVVVMLLPGGILGLPAQIRSWRERAVAAGHH